MRILTNQEFNQFKKNMTEHDRQDVREIAKQITDGEEHSAVVDDLKERYQGYGDQLAEAKAIDMARVEDGRAFDVVAQRVSGGYLVGVDLYNDTAMPVIKIALKELK